jgi:hypothetical protein
MDGGAVGVHCVRDGTSKRSDQWKRKEAMASSPCSEAIVDERDDEEEATLEIGGDGDSCGAPADRGAAPQGDEDGVLEQGEFDEQHAQHMKQRREGEGEPFTSGELLQRRRITEAAALGGFGARAQGKV